MEPGIKSGKPRDNSNMPSESIHAVTGAFGYSGKYIARRLLAEGRKVITLTNSISREKEDILINNIAWSLRHLPIIGVFGDGRYRLQPIYIEDLVDLTVKYGESKKNIIINAIGPETFTYRGLLSTVGKLIGVKRPIIPVHPWTGKLIGWFVGDVMITKDEIEGLMADLLHADKAAPTGTTRLTDWIAAHSDTLGRHYTSELARRKDRLSGYRSN
jgi:nucleoside-diphosphate-sugar epimerase